VEDREERSLTAKTPFGMTGLGCLAMKSAGEAA